MQTAGLLRSTDVAPLHRYYRPSRHPLAFPPISRCSGYTASLCSADFAAGRGGLLQLLGASLSSCCRYHPAGMGRRFGQISTVHVAFAPSRRARPLGCTFSGPPMRLLSLRPNDSLSIPKDSFVDRLSGFSFLLTIQATGFLTLSLAGLTPAEYTSLRWTYPDVRPYRTRQNSQVSRRPVRRQWRFDRERGRPWPAPAQLVRTHRSCARNCERAFGVSFKADDLALTSSPWPPYNGGA